MVVYDNSKIGPSTPLIMVPSVDNLMMVYNNSKIEDFKLQVSIDE